MTIAIGTRRTAIGSPPPKGVVVAVDHKDTWHFIIRYGGASKLVLPMDRTEAMGRLMRCIEHEDFDSIGTHARTMARALDMDYRVVSESDLELQRLITEGLVTEPNGVTLSERKSLIGIAEVIGDLAV